MNTFTFGIRFRFDPAEFCETTFDLALTNEDISFVKSYRKENGDMPSRPSRSTIRRCSEAHVDAILSYANKNVIELGEEPFTKETVSGELIMPAFYWPNNLLEP